MNFFFLTNSVLDFNSHYLLSCVSWISSFPLIRPPSFSRDQFPNRGHHGAIDLAGEVEHALKARQGLFGLVVVVAESDAQLEGDGPLLHAADEQIDLLFLDESRKFQGFVSSTRIVPSSHRSRSSL